MSRRTTSALADLPRSAERLPARYLLHPLRPAARALLRRRFSVTVHLEERVPATGPVIMAGNHTGIIDGPVMAIFAPRPVHALTKSEMFEGRSGRFLRASGQIRLDRFHPDPAAIKACLGVLRDGRVAGIFPEGTRGSGDLQTRFNRGAAYLALVSGAPVVPMIMLGTRAPGADSSALPPRGGHVDLVYGEPWRVAAEPWPRTKVRVAEATADLQAHMQAVLAEGLALTGRTLPGPLPAGDKENSHA